MILCDSEGFWVILNDYERFWMILTILCDSERYWAILSDFVPFWMIFFKAILNDFVWFWTILSDFNNFVQFWTILSDSERFCVILNDFERLWKILCDSEWFWAILNKSEQFWTILSDFDNSEQFWAILNDFELFWMILSDFVRFWTILSDAERFISSNRGVWKRKKDRGRIQCARKCATTLISRLRKQNTRYNRHIRENNDNLFIGCDLVGHLKFSRNVTYSIKAFYILSTVSERFFFGCRPQLWGACQYPIPGGLEMLEMLQQKSWRSPSKNNNNHCLSGNCTCNVRLDIGIVFGLVNISKGFGCTCQTITTTTAEITTTAGATTTAAPNTT